MRPINARKLIVLAIVFGAAVLSVVLVKHGASAHTSYYQYLPIVAASPPVYVSQVVNAPSLGGGLRVTGEVETLGTNPVYSVTLELRVYDLSSQLIGVFYEKTALLATFPGQPNPFEFHAPVFEWVWFEVNLFSWESSIEQNIAQVTVTNIEITYDANDAVSVTTIRNDNAQPLSNVQGVAWTLRQGNFISPVLVTNYLPPGATAVFTTTHLGEGGPGPPIIQAAAQGEVVP